MNSAGDEHRWGDGVSKDPVPQQLEAATRFQHRKTEIAQRQKEALVKLTAKHTAERSELIEQFAEEYREAARLAGFR